MNNNAVPASLPALTLQPRNFNVNHWLTHGGPDDLDLDAPYQRGSVWDVERRRNLIRSMLMHLPIGAITYAAVDDGPSRVIDGKQRLEAVRAFVADAFTIPGWWVDSPWVNEPADRARDLVFSELSEAGCRKFNNLAFPALEFDSATERARRDDGSWATRTRSAAEAIVAEAEVYLLINFGGVEQTADDAARATAVAAS